MKKILCFATIVVFAMITPTAFCWTVDSTGASGSADIGDFKASKNVKISVLSDAQHYAAVSGHTSGDKEYGVAYDSSVVYYKSKSKGDPVDDDAASASDHTLFSSGWTSM